ncbi:TPA: hypothetical protein U5E40_001434 [Yersinia enterocolitica]|nr:hypothetical protein [Yersinia enterocolitica]
MMDITKSREEFEDWLSHQSGHTIEYIKGQRSVTVDRYCSQYIEMPYRAWKASRESIEVELPELCGDGENDTDYIEGLNDGIIQSARALRTTGIRIKGESE